MRTIRLYHFRHYDQLRKRWIMARYVCEPPEIRCRYCDYELVGPPEIQHVPGDPSTMLSAAHLGPWFRRSARIVTTTFTLRGIIAYIDETTPDQPCHPATVLIVEAADSLIRVVVPRTVLGDRFGLLCVARPLEIAGELTEPRLGRRSYHIASRLTLADRTN